MVKTAKKVTIQALEPKEAAELSSRLDQVAREFKGQFDELENALGMMVLGRLVGWKLLVLIHNKRTIRKYEQILRISIREAFPAEGPLVCKSPAYTLLKRAGEFWKGVSGDFKLADKRQLIE